MVYPKYRVVSKKKPKYYFQVGLRKKTEYGALKKNPKYYFRFSKLSYIKFLISMVDTLWWISRFSRLSLIRFSLNMVSISWWLFRNSRLSFILCMVNTSWWIFWFSKLSFQFPFRRVSISWWNTMYSILIWDKKYDFEFIFKSASKKKTQSIGLYVALNTLGV